MVGENKILSKIIIIIIETSKTIGKVIGFGIIYVQKVVLESIDYFFRWWKKNCLHFIIFGLFIGQKRWEGVHDLPNIICTS